MPTYRVLPNSFFLWVTQAGLFILRHEQPCGSEISPCCLLPAKTPTWIHKTLFGKFDGWCGFLRATLHIIAINPFSTFITWLLKNIKETLRRAKALKWCASGIMLATHKSVPAARFHEYGIDLGAHWTMGGISALKRTLGEAELQAWEKKRGVCFLNCRGSLLEGFFLSGSMRWSQALSFPTKICFPSKHNLRPWDLPHCLRLMVHHSLSYGCWEHTVLSNGKATYSQSINCTLSITFKCVSQMLKKPTLQQEKVQRMWTGNSKMNECDNCKEMFHLTSNQR